ncbi:hypothetical protein EBZ39_02980, partial [bacterium]|nr:hypothetical protein [bacterium]
MLEASRKGLPWMLLSTGQSPKNLRMQFDDYGLEEQGAYVSLLDTQRDLDSPIQALIWFFRLLFLPAARVRALIARAGGNLERGCWIVHGDTLSTLGGAWLG